MYTPLPEQLPKCRLVECTVVEIVIIVHHAKQTLIKDLYWSSQNSEVQAPKQVGVCKKSGKISVKRGVSL